MIKKEIKYIYSEADVAWWPSGIHSCWNDRAGPVILGCFKPFRKVGGILATSVGVLVISREKIYLNPNCM